MFFFINLIFEEKFIINTNYKIELKLAETSYKNDCFNYMKNIGQISNTLLCNSIKKMLVFILKNVLFCNSVNIIIINIIIKTIWKSSKSQFIGFLIIIFNLKNL